MADLKIRATMDVGSAKASARELSQDEARRLVEERQANLSRREDYARTTQAQIQAAREAGNASRQELKELRNLHRIAVADMKAATRELSAAKREASRADAEEQRKATIAATQEQRRQQQLEKFRAGEQRQADSHEEIRRDLLARRDGRVVRRGRSLGREDVASMRDELERPVSMGKGVKSAVEPLMAIGAIATALAPLIATLTATMERVDAALKTIHETKMDVAEAQTAAATKMRENGMADKDIARVFSQIRSQGGAMSEKDMVLQIDNAIDKGSASPDGIMRFIRDRSDPREYTDNQRVANALARARRRAEQEMDQRLRSSSSAAADREAIQDVRTLEYADPDGARGTQLQVNMLSEIWRRRAAVSSALNGPIVVRLPDDQLQRLTAQTPLLGE